MTSPRVRPTTTTPATTNNESGRPRENLKEACAIVSRLVDDPLAYVQDMMTKDRILDLADNSRAFSYAAGYESLHGSWRRMNDFMIERGLVSARVESPAHLDARFLNALD